MYLQELLELNELINVKYLAEHLCSLSGEHGWSVEIVQYVPKKIRAVPLGGDVI